MRSMEKRILYFFSMLIFLSLFLLGCDSLLDASAEDVDVTYNVGLSNYPYDSEVIIKYTKNKDGDKSEESWTLGNSTWVKTISSKEGKSVQLAVTIIGGGRINASITKRVNGGSTTTVKSGKGDSYLLLTGTL